ncbi:MAG: L-histidine N(alpha)-methyltransferase [Rubrivivax sp.]
MTVASPVFIELQRDDAAQARAELIAGLQAARAQVAPKYFYDALGARLFEAITELPEYTATRDEAAIFARHGDAIAAACGTGLTLVDVGAGNCAKAAALFSRLRPQRYVAVDIAVEFLRSALERLQRAHPGLPMLGIGADLTRGIDWPEAVGAGPRLLFYPGSSIGNFAPAQARTLLQGWRAASEGGPLLIGVDLLKARERLEAAYDDAVGVTAAFNLNLLCHVNRWIGADFDPRRWAHEARFDAAASCVRMWLVARTALTVHWTGGERHFEAGERIHTEDSYKFSPEGFDALLREAGYRDLRHWTDDARRFAVFVAR